MQCWDILVHGHVQGVGYRWFVCQCASLYNIKGYVRNLSDGSVKIIACGQLAALTEFCKKVEKGHHFASVNSLEVTQIENFKDYNDFTVK